MRVLVCGGRRFNDALTLGSWLGSIHKNNGPITLLIEGGASGADFMARKFAEWQGIPVQTFDADWSRYGKKAGPLRNRQMIGEGRPDKVIGFEGGTGRPNDRRSRSRCAGFEREIEQLAICGWRCAVSEEVAGEGRGRCAPMRCISLCAKCAVWSVIKTFPGVTCALKLRESISALEDGIGMEVAIFGPAISAFAGVAGAFLGLFMTTKNTQRTLAANAQLNQVAAKERANEREARNYGDQLERFYIPYRLLASANFMLAQELRERLKHGERFFIKIFDKEWLNSLAEGDREIIQMICANADVLIRYD